MAEFTGKDLVLNWIWSGGTVTLAGDYRSCNWQPSVGQAEKTAGSDTHQAFMPTVKNATASITLVAQTGGTALAAALDAGVEGTLLISPEGTASGKRKITFPSFSQGASYTFPYADTVELNCSFVPTAAYTDSVN
jgi:hypothetical protein